MGYSNYWACRSISLLDDNLALAIRPSVVLPQDRQILPVNPLGQTVTYASSPFPLPPGDRHFWLQTPQVETGFVCKPPPHSLSLSSLFLAPCLSLAPSLTPPPSPSSPLSRWFNNIVSVYIGSVTQLLSTSLVIPLVSITPGPAGKENSEWEEGKGDGR